MTEAVVRFFRFALSKDEDSELQRFYGARMPTIN